MNWWQMLDRWNYLQAQIAQMKAEEAELRSALFSGTFPKPTEGVNKIVLPDGRMLRGTYKINRSVDKKLYNELSAKELKVVLDAGVVKLTPEVAVKAFKEAPKDVRSVADKVIREKPGLPSLELVPAPKEEE